MTSKSFEADIDPGSALVLADPPAASLAGAFQACALPRPLVRIAQQIPVSETLAVLSLAAQVSGLRRLGEDLAGSGSEGLLAFVEAADRLISELGFGEPASTGPL